MKKGQSFIGSNEFEDYSSMKESRLSLEEEQQLIKKAQEGDETAQNRLFHFYQPLVRRIIQKYLNKGLSQIDLITECNLALFYALQKYDISKRTRFFSFACPFIQRRLKSLFLDHTSYLKIPTEVARAIKKINFVREDYITCNGAIPYFHQVPDKISEYENVIKKIFNGNSLEDLKKEVVPIINEEFFLSKIDDDLDEIEYPAIIVHREKITSVLMEGILNLSEVESFVLKSYYGMDGYPQLSYFQIGQKINKSKERVRKIHTLVVNKLKRDFLNFYRNMREIQNYKSKKQNYIENSKLQKQNAKLILNL